MTPLPEEAVDRQILVCEDANAVAAQAAALFVRAAGEAIRMRGRFTVALSGGSTPKRLFQVLSTPAIQRQVQWEHVHLFWGDERYVPSDDAGSNFLTTLETLLSQVPVPPANVHRIRTELSPAEAVATNYEAEITRFFRDSHERFPAFDLVFLGLGTNAHTASLFPHGKALLETEHLVVADYVSEMDMWRITMTAPLLSAARQIVFLATGENKAPVIRDVVFGDYDPDRKPAQLIQPTRGVVTWIVDVAAAGQLPPESCRRVSK